VLELLVNLPIPISMPDYLPGLHLSVNCSLRLHYGYSFLIPSHESRSYRETNHQSSYLKTPKHIYLAELNPKKAQAIDQCMKPTPAIPAGKYSARYHKANKGQS